MVQGFSKKDYIYDSKVKVSFSSSMIMNEVKCYSIKAIHSVAKPGRLYNHAMQILNHHSQ